MGGTNAVTAAGFGVDDREDVDFGHCDGIGLVALLMRLLGTL